MIDFGLRATPADCGFGAVEDEKSSRWLTDIESSGGSVPAAVHRRGQGSRRHTAQLGGRREHDKAKPRLRLYLAVFSHTTHSAERSWPSLSSSFVSPR